MTETTEKKSPLAVFLVRSGYKERDVLAHNDKSLLFVTSNGGKYQLIRTGGIRTLKGPRYPKQPVDGE